MSYLRINFEQEIDVSVAQSTLLHELTDANVLAGDPFEKHIAEQSALADRAKMTERGRASFVKSAEELSRYFGPAIQIACNYREIPTIITVSKRFIMARFEKCPTANDVEQLTEILRSIGAGEVSFDQG